MLLADVTPPRGRRSFRRAHLAEDALGEPAEGGGVHVLVVRNSSNLTYGTTSKVVRSGTSDGAWKVEVTERVEHGSCIRSVASWHNNAKQPGTPMRQAQQQGIDAAARQRMEP